MPLEDTTATETSTATTQETAAETTATETAETAGEGETSLMGAVGVAKAEGEGAAVEETKEGEAEKKVEAVIPETYELAMPEGFTVDAALLEEATPVFKDIGLTNEQANKLVPMAAKLSENLAKQQQDTFQAMASDWSRESLKDPEIGGPKWPETETYVAKALDAFAGPAKDKDGKPTPFRKLLDDSKLGNHPEMIRMFRRIGERISEDDNFVRPDAGAHIKPSREDILYGASQTK